MRKSVVPIYRTFGGLMDGTLLLLVYALVVLLFKESLVVINRTPIWIVILFFWYISGLITGLYHTVNWVHFPRLIRMTMLTFLLMTIGLLLFQTASYQVFPWRILAWILFLSSGIIFTGRFLLFMVWQLIKDRFAQRILLIGTNTGIRDFIRSVSHEFSPEKIVACITVNEQAAINPFAEEKADGDQQHMPIPAVLAAVRHSGFEAASIDISALRQLPRWHRRNGSVVSAQPFTDQRLELPELQFILSEVRRKGASGIYCTLSPEKYPALYELAKMAEHAFITVKFIPDPALFMRNAVLVDQLNGFPVLSIRANPLEEPVNQFLKRSMDIMVSLLVIVLVLWWLIPVLALLIRLDSQGAVFFVQARSGHKNRPFRCYKFRTLRTNNEQEARQVTQLDDRVTRIGRFLRKSNLDELPQFFNVLKGDMSLVGPRPHMLNHTETFNGMHTDYMVRHLVKPGVTGLAQINGFRGEIRSPDLLSKRVEYDIRYLENWSVREDIRILFATIWVSLRGDTNAY